MELSASLNKRSLPPVVRHLTASLLALCMSFIAMTAAGETSLYRTLEWVDLVPADWKRPLILPAPLEKGQHHHVDKASIVHKLAGEKIILPGYLIPIKFEQNVVSEFLLVPFLERHTQAHIHHDPNQMVYVYLATPVPIQDPYAPVTVKGDILTTSVATDEGPTGYVIKDASMEAYVY